MSGSEPALRLDSVADVAAESRSCSSDGLAELTEPFEASALGSVVETLEDSIGRAVFDGSWVGVVVAHAAARASPAATKTHRRILTLSAVWIG